MHAFMPVLVCTAIVSGLCTSAGPRDGNQIFVCGTPSSSAKLDSLEMKYNVKIR
jgi:hypothetical protein